MHKHSVGKRKADILRAAEHGMSTKQIADAFGLTYQYVSKLINDTRKSKDRMKADRLYQLLYEASVWTGGRFGDAIMNAMLRNEIDTVEKLLALKDSDFCKMRCIGIKNIEIIHTAQELALAEIM